MISQREGGSSQFLKDFDPDKSDRERRKIEKKNYSTGPRTLFDERGFLNGSDLCDCLDKTCPGCHFPCSKCCSTKCGQECRINRNWVVEKVDVEGCSS